MHREIVRYIEQCNERKTPVDVAVIDNIENTLGYISSYNREIKNCEKKIKGLKEDICIIQSGCGHEVTTKYFDPSGNNDDYIVCNICGKEL